VAGQHRNGRQKRIKDKPKVLFVALTHLFMLRKDVGFVAAKPGNDISRQYSELYGGWAGCSFLSDCLGCLIDNACLCAGRA
jgi:hypothetical protein